MKCKLSFLFILVLFLFSTNLFASPVDVNLSTFYRIDRTVIIGPNNSSATISEDPEYAPVGLWEPVFSVPANALNLTFNYRLVVAPENEDYFDFYFNSSIPTRWYGGFEGTYVGTVTENLTGLSGNDIFLAFALNYGWGDGGYDSILTISSVQISQVGKIPEPATFLLVMTGLLGMAGIRKKFRF